MLSLVYVTLHQGMKIEATENIKATKVSPKMKIHSLRSSIDETSFWRVISTFYKVFDQFGLAYSLAYEYLWQAT